MKINLASIATYFLIGLDAGVCTDDEVRAWSFAVIGALDFPPGEIIEVSWNKPQRYLRDDLKAVTGVADLEQVGRWLLGSLHANNCTEVNIWPLLRSALHIVNATGLGESLYNDFDAIGDEMELAERGIWGTVAEARASFDALFADFRPPPFRSGWTDIIFEPHG